MTADSLGKKQNVLSQLYQNYETYTNDRNSYYSSFKSLVAEMFQKKGQGEFGTSTAYMVLSTYIFADSSEGSQYNIMAEGVKQQVMNDAQNWISDLGNAWSTPTDGNWNNQFTQYDNAYNNIYNLLNSGPDGGPQKGQPSFAQIFFGTDASGTSTIQTLTDALSNLPNYEDTSYVQSHFNPPPPSPQRTDQIAAFEQDVKNSLNPPSGTSPGSPTGVQLTTIQSNIQQIQSVFTSVSATLKTNIEYLTDNVSKLNSAATDSMKDVNSLKTMIQNNMKPS